MQITLSIPQAMLRRIDAMADSVGLSRSSFIRMKALSGSPITTVMPPEPAAPAAPETAEAALARLGYVRPTVASIPLYCHEKDLAALEALLAGPPTRSVKGSADAAPAGFVLITVEAQDLGKDAWMSPIDAGL